MLDNCFRFAPRDSIPGLIAKICKYLKDHPGWSEAELENQIKQFIGQNGVDSFNGRNGAVVLNEDDVNNLKIASAYFAEGNETIDKLDLVSLYNQGVRFVFTDFNSVTSGYNLAFVLDYFDASGEVVYYPVSTGSGSGGNIVSVNGKTGAVHLKVVDVSNGNSPDENAYIFIDESDDYPDVISSDSSKLGGQLPSYYASTEEVSQLKNDLDYLEDLVTVKSPNIFDTSKLVNKSFTDTGVPIANETAVALLNIPIESGTSIVWNGFARRTDIWNGYVYNKSDELIDRFGLTNFDSTYSGEASWGHYGNIYTAVENAKYFSIYALKKDYELGSNYQLEYGTTISEYTPFGSSVFRYEDEIVSVKNKQDKLTAGRGISIEDNVITCTVDGGGDSDIVYSYESKLLNDSYTTLAEIVNPKEILFAENNVLNEKARFLFGSHKLCAENNYFVISQDKSFSSTAKGGSLEIAFEYDGNAFEIGCRGLADFRFRVNEGNGWKYLDEKPMNVSTQNGYRTLTQIRFLYAKHRKIIIETSNPVWCLRYDVKYQVSPLTLDRPIALFIGSSITEGSASGEFPMASYGAVCSNEMGWEFINLGLGGRGIITPFDNRPSVLDAVSDITQFTDAEYIFIGGSINDSSNNASELTSGLEAIIDTVRGSLPDATIVVLGTWSPQPDSNNSVHAITNNAVKSGALTKGCAFIDSMNAKVYDASGNIVQNGTTWVTGTFAHASGDNDMSTIGNCERVYTHENGRIDHTHPGRIGHYYIGMRLASACRALKLK